MVREGVTMEISLDVPEGKTAGPGEDGGNGVGTRLLALLVLTVMSGNGT